ncbi:hypothetical protein [Roseobacter cerasinus]|uniref:hypothetical protein n=1 Tax=Roseobacter cerasinus TaxID=2602289 RepID=UPI001EEAC91A|nr:hypothetical protein [Roseobacter cerasinus]
MAGALPGSAGQKIYSGEEAAALRCANALAFTAVALESTGRISQLEKDVMLDITARILVEHVSGNWQQKKAALRVVRDRRDGVQTLDDFRRFATQCLVQFPTN